MSCAVRVELVVLIISLYVYDIMCILNNSYGYKTMLWTWVDTIKDNYPCVPPTYDSVCLTWELIEPLFAYIDRKIPDISNLMWNDAWNKRVGTTDLGTAGEC